MGLAPDPPEILVTRTWTLCLGWPREALVSGERTPPFKVANQVHGGAEDRMCSAGRWEP
jgi:hypothetical protein